MSTRPLSEGAPSLAALLASREVVVFCGSGGVGKTTAAVSMVRQRLLDKGLIYATEDYGYVDFTVPRFAEFMQRHMPYRTPRPARKRRAK